MTPKPQKGWTLREGQEAEFFKVEKHEFWYGEKWSRYVVFSLKDFRWWSIFFESDDGVMYDEGLKG